MIQVQLASRERKLELRSLHQYLSENNVGPHLSVFVQKQVVQRLQKSGDKLLESNVKVLDLLSPSLRAELRFEIFGPFLTHHPLLRLWASLDCDTAQNLCSCEVS